jgi:hypothetical protein
MPEDPVTLGELKRSLDRIERRLDSFVSADVHREQYQSIQDRVSRIEANSQWLWRTIGGTLITMIVAGLLTYAQVRGS